MCVVGHGIRSRFLIIPADPAGGVRTVVIYVRRFRCRRCATTITVLPAGVRPRTRHSLGLIVALLCAWSHDEVSTVEVRKLVQPAHFEREWAQPRRWVGWFLPGAWPPRRRARRVVEYCAARAPPASRGLSLKERAVQGAAYVMEMT